MDRVIMTHLLWGGGCSALILIIVLIVSLIKGVRNEGFTYGRNIQNNLIWYIPLAVAVGLIAGNMNMVAGKIVSIMISVFVFNLVLIAIMGRLREKCYAADTASLWAMSNILYLFLMANLLDDMMVMPLVIVRVPAKIGAAVGVVWLLGFAVYMGNVIITHFRYRRYITGNSRTIPWDSEELCNVVFRREHDKIKDGFPLGKIACLRVSGNVSTPIAIGLVNTEIVLPDREYTEDELGWIFRHELTHLERRDAGLKLFLYLCNASFWFFPPVWKASKNAAEDFELSCDEAVLDGATDEDRRAYAELILKTEGESAGFTTCLSAGGESMRYRLSQVIHPRKKSRFLGYAVGMVAVFLLISSFNLVTFTCSYGSLSEEMFGGPVDNRIADVEGDMSREELIDFIDKSEVADIGREMALGILGQEETSCDFNVDGEKYTMIKYDNIVQFVMFDDEWWDYSSYYYVF